MSELNATQARCARHGEYAILFKRPVVLADDGTIPLSASNVPPPPPGSAYQQPQAGYAQQLGYATPGYQPPFAAVRTAGPCQHYPQVAASHYCTHCSARICNVCDFTFPGNIHFCPR